MDVDNCVDHQKWARLLKVTFENTIDKRLAVFKE